MIKNKYSNVLLIFVTLVFSSFLCVGCEPSTNDNSNSTNDSNLIYDSNSITNESSSTEIINDYLIDDINIIYESKIQPSQFSTKTYIDCNLRVYFKENSSQKYINSDKIEILYDSSLLEINYTYPEQVKGNAFSFDMYAKEAGSIPIIFKIGVFEKEITIDFFDNTIDAELLCEKDKYNGPYDDITLISSYDEFEDLKQEISVLKTLKIEESFFNSNSIILCPFGWNTSTIYAEYVSIFISDNKLFINIIESHEIEYHSITHYKLFFIKIDKKYENYEMNIFLAQVNKEEIKKWNC